MGVPLQLVNKTRLHCHSAKCTMSGSWTREERIVILWLFV